MAAVEPTADMTIQKDSEILVKVEEALADLLVVSYCTEDKKFQGVLLDSNKGTLPFGVYSLHPSFTRSDTSPIKDEKLHSVSQRFTYQEPQYKSHEQHAGKKTAAKGKQQQRQKMTVRLRARKVLCSNCNGICNENSENVDVKKRKLTSPSDDTWNDAQGQEEDNEKGYLMRNTLIPKLSRLQPAEISNAMRGTKKSNKAEPTKASERSTSRTNKNERSEDDRVPQEVAFVNVTEDINMNCEDKNDKASDAPFNSMFSSAKTLKICFGAGEGTVVKIPPIVGDYNEDSGVGDMSKQSEIKAAKKALKKAKRQAKKNTTDVSSKTGLSPKHIGALSPRNNVADSTNIGFIEKKHKHKVKHKKRHRIQKERDENTSNIRSEEDGDMNYFSDIKDSCLNQKLSISLRRLSNNSFEKREGDSGSEGWESDTVPEFPESSTESSGGKAVKVSPGDIVWGKLVGFPWWPGRVLSMTPSSGAHVAWYASTTSSHMPSDSLTPFLEEYEVRFNKKKRGAYKKAVKQALLEAKKTEPLTEDPLASPTHNLPTMSPRPINVFS